MQLKKIIAFCAFVLLLASPLPAANYFLFKGDSLTVAKGEHDVGSRYLGSYSYMMDLGTAIKENMGCSGQTLQDAMTGQYVMCVGGGWDGPVGPGHDGTNLGFISELTANSASAKRTVVLLMGSNDFAGGRTAAQVEGYATTFSNNVRATDPGAKIIGVTPPPSNLITGDNETARLAYNSWIVNTAVGLGVFDYVVNICFDAAFDAVPNAAADYNNGTYYYTDHTHLMDAGELIIANAVKAVIVANGLNGGSTYYVNATGGDDSRSTATAQNIATPWLTVQKCATNAVAGDTCSVAAGTYNERPTTAADGTSTSHITFTTSAGATIGGFYITKDYIGISGFNYNGSGVSMGDAVIVTSAASDYAIVESGSYTGTHDTNAGIGLLRIAGTNGTFRNLSVTNPGYHSVDMYPTQNGTLIETNTFTDSNGWDIFRIQGSNLTIRGNTITASNPLNNANHSDIFQSMNDASDNVSMNIVIEKNTVLSGSGYQLGMFEDTQSNSSVSAFTWRNNLFADLTNTLNVCAPNFTFYNNTFANVGTPNSSDAISLCSVAGKGHATGMVIKNNIFYDCGTSTNIIHGWYHGDLAPSVADYNIVVGTGAGTTKTGFAETHGINGTSPSLDGSYNATVSTPSGVNLSSTGFSTDIHGATRSLWSMGADEYTGTIIYDVSGNVCTTFCATAIRGIR